MAKRKASSLAVVSDDDWQAKCDLDTLIEAERIEKDPKRKAKAQALAKKRMMEAAAVAAESE